MLKSKDKRLLAFHSPLKMNWPCSSYGIPIVGLLGGLRFPPEAEIYILSTASSWAPRVR